MAFAQSNYESPFGENVAFLKSKRANVCSECEEEINVGDPIYYDFDNFAAIHEDCAPEVAKKLKGTFNALTGERTQPRFQMEMDPDPNEYDDKGKLAVDGTEPEWDRMENSGITKISMCQCDSPSCQYCSKFPGLCDRPPVVELKSTQKDNDHKLQFCNHCAIDAQECGEYENLSEDTPEAMIADLRIAVDKLTREVNHYKMCAIEAQKQKALRERTEKAWAAYRQQMSRQGKA